MRRVGAREKIGDLQWEVLGRIVERHPQWGMGMETTAVVEGTIKSAAWTSAWSSHCVEASRAGMSRPGSPWAGRAG